MKPGIVTLDDHETEVDNRTPSSAPTGPNSATCPGPKRHQEPRRITADAELQLYIDDTECFEDPLDSSKSLNKDRYKRLPYIAWSILSARATTAGVEKRFSICGILLTNWRLRTVNRHFKTQVFCMVSLHLIDKGSDCKGCSQRLTSSIHGVQVLPCSNSVLTNCALFPGTREKGFW